MVRLRSPAPAIYGGIPERPKGADCKSVVTDFAGPNPASPTITRNRPLRSVFCYGVRSSRFAPELAIRQACWSAYRNRRSKSSLFRRRLRVSSSLMNTQLPSKLLRNRPLRSVFCYGRRSRHGNSAAKPTLCRIPPAESTERGTEQPRYLA